MFVGKHGIYATKKFNLTRDEEMVVQNFQQELSLLSELQHPNIIEILGHRKELNVMYLFMEMFDGNLYMFIKELKSIWFSAHEVKKYCRQILGALNVVHKKGIAHRDIKVINLLRD